MSLHLAILYQSIKQKFKYVFSNDQIVIWRKLDPQNHWSLINQAFGYYSILDLTEIVENDFVERNTCIKMKKHQPNLKSLFLYTS